MSPKDVFAVVATEFDAVNRRILDQLHSEVDLVETISQYLVDGGGKRVRPLLVLLSARCCGYQGEKHTLLATIIEFLHTATLLHDDVVDMSELRRGRSTANAVWGNASSVLVGDFLYSRAFQMMVELGDMQIMQILANSTNLISEGEVRQLVNAHNDNLTQKEYLEVIQAKTAVLFQASSHTSAVLSGVDKTLQVALRDYGMKLGLTFQLIDDLLDYDGDVAEMGKNVGDDLAEGKMTLPLIYTLENCSTEQAKLIRAAVKEDNHEHMAEIISLVRNCGALDYTRKCALREADAARELLQLLPRNRYRDALNDLVELAVNRTN